MEDSSGPYRDLTSSVFIPLIISFSGIVTTAISIVVYHFVVAWYRLTRTRFRGVADGSVSCAEPQKGLDPKTLKAIQILHYSSKPGQILFRVNQSQCPVCLGELEERVLVRLLPNCRHLFHVTCVDKWFSFHTSCPVCRSPVHPVGISEVALSVHEPEEEDRDQVVVEDRSVISVERRRSCVLPLVSPPMDQEKRRRLVMGLQSGPISCLS